MVDVYFPGKKGVRRANYCFVTFDNWRAAQRASGESQRAIRGKVWCERSDRVGLEFEVAFQAMLRV